jgi:release factor glutamine methyltransferase
MKSTTFHGLELGTSAGLVMIPRPASEKLVNAAIALLGDKPARVVDVGTGSGAIAIAIAAALPQTEVFATDTSAAAVALARLNAARVGLSSRVTVARGNLLDPISGSFDLIVANLPYLPAAETARRPDLADEPREAVFAPGDGLGPYRRLIAASRERMSRDGTLIILFHGDMLMATRETLNGLAATLTNRARAVDDQFPVAA